MNAIKTMTFISSEMYGTHKCTPEANADQIMLNRRYTYTLTTAVQATKFWHVAY